MVNLFSPYSVSWGYILGLFFMRLKTTLEGSSTSFCSMLKEKRLEPLFRCLNDPKFKSSSRRRINALMS